MFNSFPIFLHLLGGKKVRKREAWRPIYPHILLFLFLLMTLSGFWTLITHLLLFPRNSKDSMLRVWSFQGHGEYGDIFLLSHLLLLCAILFLPNSNHSLNLLLLQPRFFKSVTELPASEKELTGHAQQAWWISVEGSPISGLDSGF